LICASMAPLRPLEDGKLEHLENSTMVRCYLSTALAFTTAP
jgi:hypothetical protein